MVLSPPFRPTTKAYTASVPYPTWETTVRPELAHLGDTYTISLAGKQLTENAPALARLAPGVNAITVAVASADGNATNTYAVTVSRELPSNDAGLASLTLGGISPDRWTPAFDADVHQYDVRASHSVARTVVLPATAHAAATFAVASNPADALTHGGYGTAIVELAPGAVTTVTVTVTAEDGVATQDYVVRIHRAGP